MARARGLWLGLLALCAACGVHAQTRAYKAPERLTLAGVDYVRAADKSAKRNGPWLYTREDEQEGGPWTTEIELSWHSGLAVSVAAEAQRVERQLRRQAHRSWVSVSQDDDHSYWTYVVEPPIGVQSAYVSAAGKSFHHPGCHGVVRYEFRTRHPMAWVPDERMRVRLRDALRHEAQEQVLAALRRERWQPACG